MPHLDCIPISLCCRMPMVVVTGSTFEMLGFFFFPASRESRESTTLGKSLRGAARRAVATYIHTIYKYKLKCLYGENSKTGSVKVPVKLFGRSAAVKVTFTPKKYFYGAPKNGARGA